MLKAAWNWPIQEWMLSKNDAPSYFIQCLLYNFPNRLSALKLAPTYTTILDWREEAQMKGFKCQNGQVSSF